MSNKYGSSFIGGVPSAAPKQAKVNITAEDLQTLVCEYCEGEIFAEGMIIKTVSPLLTENGKEGMLPVPAFYCVRCHQAVQKYLPKEMQKKPIVSAS